MNFINRSHIYVLCLLAVVFSAASCNKNGLFPDGKGLSSQIRLSVKSGEPFSKSSAADDAPGTLIASYPLSDDPENDLVLNVYERDFTELPSLMSSDAEAAGTKGEVMTTSKLTTFQMLAYANGEWYDNKIASGQGSLGDPYERGLYFGGTDGIAVNRSGSGTIADPYVWDLATEQYWLNEVPISFWSWNGTKPAVAWNSTTERYDVASLTGFTVAGASGTAVTSQVDPIFAYNGESRTFNDLGSITGKTSTNSAYTRTDNEVDIHFYHALAAVNFDISQVAPGSTVDNIKLSNIYSVGDCDITVSGGIPQFAWKNRASKADFSQAFAASDFNTTDPQKGRQPLATSQKVFLMIPQTLQSDATITVTFNGTDNVTRPIPLDDGDPQQWLPGKYYTYAIQRLGDVKLDIMGPLEPVKTTTVDAHYENVMLRFGKSKPGEYSVSGDASWLSFAAPVSSTEFAAYSGGTVDFAGLISELQGTGPKTHFIENGGFYYTQAFVNENYSTTGQLSDFVNKPDRSVTLTIKKTASSSPQSVTISQHSIKSPYNLSSSNPLGVETVEESLAEGGDPCANRNRGGSGPWRQPTLQEYYYIWYGYNTVNNNSWIPLSDAAYATSETGVHARYDGVASTWGPLSGTGRVRCVRNLGSGSTPDPMYTISDRVVTMQNVGNGSLRLTEKTGEYSAHTVTNSDNKLPAKFKVAQSNLTYVSYAYTPTETGSEQFVLSISYVTGVSLSVVSNSSGGQTVIGKLKINNYDEHVKYECAFAGGKGGAPDCLSNSLTIDDEGNVDFMLDTDNWSAGNNSFLCWGLQPYYIDENGTRHDIGSPNCLVLSMYNKVPVYGDSDKVSNGKAVTLEFKGGKKSVTLSPIIVNGKDGAEDYTLVGSNYWYFSFMTAESTNARPIFEYSDVFEEGEFTEEGNTLCATYHEGDRVLDVKEGVDTYDDCGKWRVPNQRELSIILREASNLGVTLGEDTYYSSKTTYETSPTVYRPYYYYNGEMTNTGGPGGAPINSKLFKIRCVRDIE